MPTGFADYSLDQSGVLGVVNGGTGQAALTQNGVLLGNGGGAIVSTAAGTARQVCQVPAGGGPPDLEDPDFGSLDVTPPASGGGIVLHGQTGAGAVSPAYSFYDDTAGAGRGVLAQIASTGQWLSDAAVGDMILANSVIKFGAGGSSASWASFSTSGFTLASRLISYHGLATQGQGFPVIVQALQTVLSGATQYWPFTINPAPVGTYRLSAYLVEGAAGGAGNLRINLTYYNYGSGSIALDMAPAVTGGAVGACTQGTYAFYHGSAAGLIQITVLGPNTGNLLFTCVLERLI